MKKSLLAFVVVVMVLALSVQPSQARFCGPGLVFGSVLGAAVVSSVIYSAVSDSHPVYYAPAPVYYAPSVVYTQPAPVIYNSAPVTYAAPTTYTAPASTVAAPTTVVTASAPSVPYGYVSNGTIKSPYTSFTISLAGRSSGDVIYDANTGAAFKVP